MWSEESGKDSAHDRAVHHWKRLAEEDQDLLLEDPGPELMFDDRVYKRGALLLHALRLTLGDDVFFDALRAWTTEHAHTTVSTQMFVDLLETRTGEDLASLFESWLSQTALPELPDAS